MTTFAEAATHALGDTGHTADHNLIAGGLAIALGVNVLDAAYAGGADSSGVADSTTAVTAAIAAAAPFGANVAFPPGTYLFNGAALSLTTAGTTLAGSGAGATKLTIGSSFSGTGLVSAAADHCKVRDLSIVGASTTTTSNPACNGIELSGGWQHCRFTGLFFEYVNGWAIESVGGSSRANLDTMIDSPIIRNCAGGVHVQGVTGSSWAAEHWLTNVQAQQIGVGSGANAGLHGIYIQDASDVIITAPNVGQASGELGGAVVIAGACSTVVLTAPDVGANNISGAASSIWITSTGNGSPSGVTVTGGSSEGGLAAIQVDAGSDITLIGTRGHQAYTDGLQVNGGEVLALGVSLASNNQSAGTAYDINCSSISSGNLRANACRTESAIGTTTAGKVPNAVSTGSHGYFQGCFFLGSGTTSSNAFTGTPEIVRNCTGYNPKGSVTAGTVGTSPYTPGGYQGDLSVIFTAVNGMTAFAIGGTTVASPPAAGVPYRVTARQSMTVTWATTAPTWIWIAD